MTIKIEPLKPGRKSTRDRTSLVIYQNESMRLYQLFKRKRISEKDYKISLHQAKIEHQQRLIKEISDGEKPNEKIYK